MVFNKYNEQEINIINDPLSNNDIDDDESDYYLYNFYNEKK
jgi:hypothetical protein